MRLCVVGAGAIGGYMGIKLARAGAQVSLVLRGANLEAVRKSGLRLIEEDGAQDALELPASDRMADLGAQDVVLLGMKAHQVAAVAPDVHTLLGPDTVIVTTQNGIPWWYFHKHSGPFANRGLESVDPGGVIASYIDVARVVGCVVYPACELIAPGVIRHIEGTRFPLGELDGADTPRVKAIAELFRKAGFKSPVLGDIRSEIWLKLWGNLSFNPISALTHATLVDICQFPPTRALAAAMMSEAQAIAHKLGIQFKVSLEKRIAGAEAVGKHKTSMLQDVEAGRALELDALMGAVIELGKLTETAVPSIEAVYACASLLANTLHDQGGYLRINKK